MTDFYAILGVERDASDAEIRTAYRVRAKKAHPDQGGDEKEFHKLNNAKMVLLDPRRRAKYDATGEADLSADNELSEALNIAIGALDMVLGAIGQRGADPTQFDLIGDARRRIDSDIQREESNRESLERGLSQIRSVAKRMKAKSGKTNRLKPLFEARLVEYARRIAASKQATDKMKRAYDLLGEHEFDYEIGTSELGAFRAGFSQVFGSHF